jgi:hypothetical protein
MQTINDILPIELFFRIFHYLNVADGPLGLRGPLLVCRLWNTIIFNDSHLWTNLVFSQTFIQHLIPFPARLLNYIERCGDLSGDHFIRMAVDFAAIYDHFHPAGTHAQQPGQQRVDSSISLLMIARAMARARTFRERIRTLIFSGGHAPSSELRIMASVMMDLVKERLQHLELHMYPDDPTGSIVCIPRSVETVFLLDPNWGEHKTPLGPVTARQLTLQRTSPWHSEDLSHLCLYQSLTELRLIWSPTGVGEPRSFEAEFFHKMGTSEHTRHSVLLPSVITLYMRGAIPLEILDPLNLPALATIEVRNQDLLQPLSTVQLTTLHDAITTLVVRFTPEAADGWSDALTAVLMGAPRLQTLVAPHWMERHLFVHENVKVELV